MLSETLIGNFEVVFNIDITHRPRGFHGIEAPDKFRIIKQDVSKRQCISHYQMSYPIAYGPDSQTDYILI
jgi:hypothetical protein